MNAHELTGICEVCHADHDFSGNYADQPHDGYWCTKCLAAYVLPRAEALQLLRRRLHASSSVLVDAA